MEDAKKSTLAGNEHQPYFDPDDGWVADFSVSLVGLLSINC